MSKILIVDDEPDIIEMLSDYFSIKGYDVVSASNGNEVFDIINNDFDLILLDINMPNMSGIEVCEKIRSFVSCPIIFLTAKTEEKDIIKGLEVGGDDYITKPFSLSQLNARISAHIRREKRIASNTNKKIGNEMVIDYDAKELYINNTLVPLSKTEFSVVEFLSMNDGQIFDKNTIYDRVWGFDSEGTSMTVVEHIRKIRAKLSEHTDKDYLQTMYGAGYKWNSRG